MISFKLVEDSGIGFPALLSEPVKVSFPIRLALGARRRLRDVADRSAVAAQLKLFATLDRIENACSLPVQISHGQRLHI